MKTVDDTGCTVIADLLPMSFLPFAAKLMVALLPDHKVVAGLRFVSVLSCSCPYQRRKTDIVVPGICVLTYVNGIYINYTNT